MNIVSFVLPVVLLCSLLVCTTSVTLYITHKQEFRARNLWFAWLIYYGTLFGSLLAAIVIVILATKRLDAFVPCKHPYILFATVFIVPLGMMLNKVKPGTSSTYMPGDEDSDVKKASPILHYWFVSLLIALFWSFILMFFMIDNTAIGSKASTFL
jgi:hypothetical protein